MKPLRANGFTLVELLTALLVLSLVALMSYRGLAAVLDSREHVRQETAKWRSVSAFFARFGRDVALAAPRPVRIESIVAPAWQGSVDTGARPSVAFSRFASAEGVDTARRLGYRLNEKQEIELSLWPGLDMAPGVQPMRYPVLTGVVRFELRYLTSARAWVDAWPVPGFDAQVPEAVQLRIVLASGEDIVRVFALKS